MYNVPDDWDYYTNCDICGSCYHMSEGGCGCLVEPKSCQCGACGWEVFETDYDGSEVVCCKCSTGPAVTTKEIVCVHIARTQHGEHIKPGDTYRLNTTMGYYPNGARWVHTQKTRTTFGTG